MVTIQPALQTNQVTARDRVRQVVVVVSVVLALAGSAIGSGAFGGTKIKDAAGGALAADATLLAPGTGAFQIWSVIYLGLIAYAVFQALSRQAARPLHRRIGGLSAASMLVNAAWILSIQAGLLLLSVPVIAALLVVLVLIVRGLAAARRAGEERGLADTLIVDATLGLYLGWVTIATVANVTAALQQAGFDGFGVPGAVWAVVVLAISALLGVLGALGDDARIAPALALAWGLVWITIARATGEPASVPTAVAAAIAAAVVLAVPLVLRLRRRTRPS